MDGSRPPAEFRWSPAGGRLGPVQRWALVLGALRARLTGVRRGDQSHAASLLDPRAIDHIAMPTDALAQAAYRLADSAQPQWLTQHALRAYAWGALLALSGGLRYDRASFFAACMLHDIGLTPHADSPARDCFAVRGARYADRALREAGVEPAVAAHVARAIALHLDIAVRLEEDGAEAHLLRAGSGLDVMGQRAREIPAELRRAALARHPRLGFKQQICSCLVHEAALAPRTRMGVYVRRLGFVDLVRRAPFDE
jgi:hypothetical protein